MPETLEKQGPNNLRKKKCAACENSLTNSPAIVLKLADQHQNFNPNLLCRTTGPMNLLVDYIFERLPMSGGNANELPKIRHRNLTCSLMVHPTHLQDRDFLSTFLPVHITMLVQEKLASFIDNIRLQMS